MHGNILWSDVYMDKEMRKFQLMCESRLIRKGKETAATSFGKLETLQTLLGKEPWKKQALGCISWMDLGCFGFFFFRLDLDYIFHYEL